MHGCQCQGIESVFDQKQAQNDLKRYRQKGPAETTRLLVDGLKAAGVSGLTLLDIGGGVGAVSNGLLAAGVREATDVDASAAFIDAAQDEARRQGHADRIHFYHGDFVQMAKQVPAADVVTLDRVICCYHDMDALVGLSSARARKLYGVVFPRDTWWAKAVLQVVNLFYWAQRSPFRVYLHPTRKVEDIARGNGLRRDFIRQTFLWQVVIYTRQD